MNADEIENDLNRYYKYMRSGNADGCIAIEEKYGLLGETPEMVTTDLRDEIERLRIVTPVPSIPCEHCGEVNHCVHRTQ